MLNNNIIYKKGFTLAEVLVTLAIIGVVAALTIPVLINKYNEKAWQTASRVFDRKIEEALKVMNTQKVLTGYSTTQDFLNELSKNIKIIKICSKNNLTECFPKTINGNEQVVDLANKTFSDVSSNIDTVSLINAKQLGHNDWTTETYGVLFANGVTALLAYNNGCNVNPFANNENVKNCIAMIYDTSGFTSPNVYGKDIRTINADVKGQCNFKINGQCYGQPVKVDRLLTYYECKALVDSGKYGSFYCYDNEYMNRYEYQGIAAAAQACGHVDNIMRDRDFGYLMNYLYNSDVLQFDHAYSFDSNRLDEGKLNSIGLSVGDEVAAKSGDNNDNDLWSAKDFYHDSIGGREGGRTLVKRSYLFCKIEN